MVENISVPKFCTQESQMSKWLICWIVVLRLQGLNPVVTKQKPLLMPRSLLKLIYQFLFLYFGFLLEEVL